MTNTYFKSKRTGFTIVELLVVIVVIGILAAIVIAYINPAEISAQARDSRRVSDLDSIKKSVDLFIIDKPDPTLLGTPQKVYVSIPDTSPTCANIANLPILPAGWSYNCVTSTNLNKIDGTGWLPINFTSVASSSSLRSLPVDPQNDSNLTKYYQYIPNNTGGYELASLMESEKYGKVAAKDGGTDASRIEVGTDLTLWRTASGLVGYWPFEETGSIANNQTLGLQDLSGFNNDGVASNANGVGMSFVSGKIGNALQLDGLDDYVNMNKNIAGGFSKMSYSVWFKPNTNGYMTIVGEWSGGATFIGQASGGKINLYLSTTLVNLAWQNAVSDFISLSNWHNMTVVYSGANEILYIDGSQAFSAAATGTLWACPTCYFRIGASANGSQVAQSFFNGQIDEVLLYNRSLSASEVKSIYNAGK